MIVLESVIKLLELEVAQAKIRQRVKLTLALPGGRELVKPLDARAELIHQEISAQERVLSEEFGRSIKVNELYEDLGLEREMVALFGGDQTLADILKVARYEPSHRDTIISTLGACTGYAVMINEILLERHDFLMRTLDEDKNGYLRGEHYTLDAADTVQQGIKHPILPAEYPEAHELEELWELMAREITIAKKLITEL